MWPPGKCIRPQATASSPWNVPWDCLQGTIFIFYFMQHIHSFISVTVVFSLSAIFPHVYKVLGGVYASNTSGITAQHLEWVSCLLIDLFTDHFPHNLLLYSHNDWHGLAIFLHYRYIKQHWKFFRNWPSRLAITIYEHRQYVHILSHRRYMILENLVHKRISLHEVMDPINEKNYWCRGGWFKYLQTLMVVNDIFWLRSEAKDMLGVRQRSLMWRMCCQLSRCTAISAEGLNW